MILLDAICMLLIAIGESLKSLDKVTENKLLPTYPSIPWKQIKGMRTWFAHQYLNMDKEIIWDVLHNGIPQLSVFCESMNL